MLFRSNHKYSCNVRGNNHSVVFFILLLSCTLQTHIFSCCFSLSSSLSSSSFSFSFSSSSSFSFLFSFSFSSSFSYSPLPLRPLLLIMSII